MKKSAPYDIKIWRIALGIVLGALTTSALTFVTFGILPAGFLLALSAILAVAAACLVIVPFLIIAMQRQFLTVGRALMIGGLLTGTPTLVFNLTMQTPIAGDQSFVLTRTLLGVLYGVMGAAVAWLVAIGPRVEPLRRTLP